MEYFDELLKACGIAVIAAVCIAVVGKLSDTASLMIRLGGGVALFAVLTVLLSENVAALRAAVESVAYADGTVGNAFSLMLKALGIALVSKFCSDICRDCGEATLASGVEGIGRMAIIALCIPVLSDILGFAAEVLERGM